MEKSIFNGIVRAPIHTARLPVAAPTRRPAFEERSVINPWGWVKVSGKIGEQHLQLTDLMVSASQKKIIDESGRLNLLVDSAVVRAALGWDKINYSQIEDLLEDMRIAKVEIFVKKMNIKTVGGIVSGYSMANVEKRAMVKSKHLTTREGDENKSRALTPGFWKIIFSENWTALTESDMHYQYRLRSVLALKNGVSQALARFCLSHKSVNEDIISVLHKIGNKRRVDKALDSISYDAEGLSKLGILVERGRVMMST